MPIIEIGCCGAYCGTCRVLAEQKCRGCKLGYESGERDPAKARCVMKRCCLQKLGAEKTCADCPDYETCDILRGFYGKNGYKYQKYRQATEYIRRQGYEKFLVVAEKWTGVYGKIPK